MIEIKFSGRGGQGVVIASQILGLSFFRTGMYAQCYSVYGGERRGAPLVSFLRVDNEKILLKCGIKNPDEIIYLDQGMVNPKEIFTILRPGGRILINTNQSIEAFEEVRNFDIGLINALSIAEESGLGRTINTAILGAYCGFTGRLPLEGVLKAIEEKAPAKKEANVKAAQEAFKKITIYKARNENGTPAMH